MSTHSFARHPPSGGNSKPGSSRSGKGRSGNARAAAGGIVVAGLPRRGCSRNVGRETINIIHLLELDPTRNQTVTEWNRGPLSFSSCRRRRLRVDCSGGSISSNGGALLLRELDRRMGLTARVARALGDRCQHAKVRHKVETMVRQRVHAVALGYEDLNDHDRAALHGCVRHRLSSEPAPPPIIEQGAEMAATTLDSVEIIVPIVVQDQSWFAVRDPAVSRRTPTTEH